MTIVLGYTILKSVLCERYTKQTADNEEPRIFLSNCMEMEINFLAPRLEINSATDHSAI